MTIVLKDGVIPKDGVIIIDYKNTTSLWLANQLPGASEHQGMVYVAINGEKINKFPKYIVKSGQEKYRRVIVPSSVRPGESFKVKLISLDRYNNLTETEHIRFRYFLQGQRRGYSVIANERSIQN